MALSESEWRIAIVYLLLVAAGAVAAALTVPAHSAQAHGGFVLFCHLV